MLIGKTIKGFCGGLFGRDFWGNAKIENMGVDWIVIRDENGTPFFAFDKNIYQKIKDWLTD